MSENAGTDDTCKRSTPAPPVVTPTTARSTTKIRVGCVPEHFSSPILLAQETGLFQKHHLDVDPVFVPGGTGAMFEQLRQGHLDVVIALTEGAVTDILKNRDCRLVSTYVMSPLKWAIVRRGAGTRPAASSTGSPRSRSGSTGNVQSLSGEASPHRRGLSSDSAEVEWLRGKTVGISRFGSGSHLMAQLLAHQHGWDPGKDFRWEVLHNFQGLREGVQQTAPVASSAADFFMWELFMTRPFIDRGELELVATMPTPWPCFMVVARHDFLDQLSSASTAAVNDQDQLGKLSPLELFVQCMQESAKSFMQPDRREQSVQYIQDKWHLSAELARQWMATVQFAEGGGCFVDQNVLEKVVRSMVQVGVIDRPHIPQSPRRLPAVTAAGDSPAGDHGVQRTASSVSAKDVAPLLLWDRTKLVSLV